MKTQPHASWLLVVAIGTVLFAAGALIDFMLKREEVRKLHDFFLKIADALARTPLKQWQTRIARAGVRFLDKLTELTFVFILTWINTVFEPLNKWKTNLGTVLFWLFVLALPACYAFTHWWMLGAICLPFLFILLAYAVGSISNQLRRFEIYKSHSNIFGYLRALSPTTLSALLSLMAAFVSIYVMPESLLNSHWYTLSDGGIRPSSPFLLPLINFPFDVATILVTIWLLRLVHQKEKFFFPVALLDTFFSAALAVLLHASLLTISNGWNILSFPAYCVESALWFRDIGICLLDSWRAGHASQMFNNLPELHLLPMLLTTFVPVAIYMSVFIFLAFAKVVMSITGRFFAAIGEREESVFKQFALLLAALMTAIKAIYDFLIAA